MCEIRMRNAKCQLDSFTSLHSVFSLLGRLSRLIFHQVDSNKTQLLAGNLRFYIMAAPKLVTSNDLLVCCACGAQYDATEQSGLKECRICEVRFSSFVTYLFNQAAVASLFFSNATVMVQWIDGRRSRKIEQFFVRAVHFIWLYYNVSSSFCPIHSSQSSHSSSSAPPSLPPSNVFLDGSLLHLGRLKCNTHPHVLFQDPRQFIPASGQSFTTLGKLQASGTYRNVFEACPVNGDRLLEIWTEPKVRTSSLYTPYTATWCYIASNQVHRARKGSKYDRASWLTVFRVTCGHV